MSHLRVSASFIMITCLLETQVYAQQARPARNTQLGSVITSGQKGGATVGYVKTFNQTTLPNLVRGPQLEHFKQQFTIGARLLRTMRGAPQTNDQLEFEINAFTAFTQDTAQWLQRDISDYAAERFLFTPQQPAYAYALPNLTKPGYLETYGNIVGALPVYLTNLDTLMRDPSIYAEPKRLIKRGK